MCRLILSDINRLKRVEERQKAVNDELERTMALLQTSEQKYASLVDVTSDTVWEVYPYGRFTYLSTKFQSFTGYPASEFLGRTPQDLVYEEGTFRRGEHFLAIVAARNPFASAEFTIMHRDGHLIMVEVSGTPLFNSGGEYLGMCGKTSDITERKKLEQKLRNSEEQYRMLSVLNLRTWNIYSGPSIPPNPKLKEPVWACRSVTASSKNIEAKFGLRVGEVKEPSSLSFSPLKDSHIRRIYGPIFDDLLEPFFQVMPITANFALLWLNRPPVVESMILQVRGLRISISIPLRSPGGCQAVSIRGSGCMA